MEQNQEVAQRGDSESISLGAPVDSGGDRHRSEAEWIAEADVAFGNLGLIRMGKRRWISPPTLS